MAQLLRPVSLPQRGNRPNASTRANVGESEGQTMGWITQAVRENHTSCEGHPCLVANATPLICYRTPKLRHWRKPRPIARARPTQSTLFSDVALRKCSRRCSRIELTVDEDGEVTAMLAPWRCSLVYALQTTDAVLEKRPDAVL